jgi:hypothetical protein
MYYRNLILSLVIFFLVPNFSLADDKKDMGGWEIDGEYNKHYDLDEWDEFNATIVSIKKVVPLPGMSPGVALIVRDSASEKITIHLCPTWYAKPGRIGVRNGERIRVKGVWAEINGEELFMASKVKKGLDFEFKVRLTKNGKPFWTREPEELERELRAK